MALPPRFPCWCRATYSWGGENKKDLGFIEGDLIEALNAGDGLWWTGRLRRDPRAIGSFPSNFVKVLDESFQPVPNSRNNSPRNTPPRQVSPTKQKSVFRKPFQAYENAGKEGDREDTPESDKEKVKREKSKFRPYASMKTAQPPTVSRETSRSPVKAVDAAPRIPLPPPRGHRRPVSRAASPQPTHFAATQDQWSTVPGSDYSYGEQQFRPASPAYGHPQMAHSRPTSPLPVSFHDGSPYPQLIPSRTPSPQPPLEDDLQSSPPPPPPTHRILYQPSRAPSPAQDLQIDTHNPVPPSPGMTPSPLRDAMNDVMSSLHDMTIYSTQPTPRAENVWSPEEFELIRSHSQNTARVQAASRMNSVDHGNEYYDVEADPPPRPPLKGSRFTPSRATTSGSQFGTLPSRPTTSSSQSSYDMPSQKIRNRKSAFELGARERLHRTYTAKTNATNSTETSSATQSSTSTQLTSRSIMSGHSAGGFSATSAGSLARRKFGLGSQKGNRPNTIDTRSMLDLKSGTSHSSGSGPSYHDSHASEQAVEWASTDHAGVFGGLSTPINRKSGFFRRMIESAKSTAMTGAANARATVSNASRPGSRAGSPIKNVLMSGKDMTGFGSDSRPASAAGSGRDMVNGNEWMQVRRDVNRSNSLSRKELDERHDRSEMLDLVAFQPVDMLHEQIDGDEGLDGLAITEPTDFNTPNLALVDKSTRFISSVPSMVTPAALAQSYLCRPYRSDVQRLRAIFTWTAERIAWEEEFEGVPDPRRVIQSKRGCSQEVAVLVRDMCSAIGLRAEAVRGYLKAPGEMPDSDSLARGNHWWNAVIIDGEWRIIDASLASPSHPKRGDYSTASSQVAESWYFLARPSQICYTHAALLPEQQHVVPPPEHEILAALPCACPAYFRHSLELADFDTSILHLDGLDMVHLHVVVPEDVECVAEVEARAYARDSDGDFYESDDFVTKRALAQSSWTAGRKQFTIKALLPSDSTTGILKIYAGKRGLMHSIKDNPHSLAFALPITHSGQNPCYDFLSRHPTPHAQRHDLYVSQPQCAKLVMNSTFVFSITQHPSALSRFTPDTWGGSMRPSSPLPGTPYARPGSAMSMMSSATSAQGSSYSDSSNGSMTPAQMKPAKLAIQSPSQKIIRLSRKTDGHDVASLCSMWETVIKIGERGTWRGLVLADRSARWCVFAEWECV